MQITKKLADIFWGIVALGSGAVIVHATFFGLCLFEVCQEKTPTPHQAEVAIQQPTNNIQIAMVPEARAMATSAPAPVPPPRIAVAAQIFDEQFDEQPQLPPITIKKTPKTQTRIASLSPKSASVNLDKLSMAVAMTETHNCQDDQGSALVNNCHGFKRNGKFIAFSSPEESHAYFKELWVNGYGGVFPTFSLAKKYSGNDNPTSWLNNVTYYYNKL